MKRHEPQNEFTFDNNMSIVNNLVFFCSIFRTEGLDISIIFNITIMVFYF